MEFMGFVEKSGWQETTFWESVRRDSKWGEYLTSREQRTLAFAQHIAGAPSTALEIGCDGGYWSKQLADNGWRMICTDVNEEALELARRRISSATCIRVDHHTSSLPCGPSSMTMIVCMEVFPVVNAGWFPSEAARVLKPGGVVVGVVSNRLSWRGQAYRMMRVLDPKRKHHDDDASLYKLSYADWKQNLAAAGLRIVHEEGLAWLPFPRKSNSSLIPPLTRMEQAVGLVGLPAVSPWIAFVAQKT